MRNRDLLCGALVVASLLVTGALPHGQTGSCEEPALAQRDVEDYLRYLPADNVLRKVMNCGVTFIPDDQAVQRLRSAGATDALMAVLAPPRTPTPGATWTPLTDRRQMVWVPPGDFSMGSPETERDRGSNEPVHQVRIDRGFWIDSAEVSKQAYQRFVLTKQEWQKANVARANHDGNYLKDWEGTNFPAGEGDLPVVFVSWPAAAAYALRAGKRLPTEAQWEYAARAGSKTAYWWGDDFDPAKANRGASLRSVGLSGSRNPWGLTDILGNAWEWTSSQFRPYPYRADDGREDAQAAGDRVLRGGAAGYGVKFLRSANRNNAGPETTNERIGFRCVW